MSKRIQELDGLRACAIFAVFLRHTYWVSMTWMGVDLFFVLSGFLITGILLDAPKNSFGAYIGAFYGRRARRILPPYLLTLVVVSLLFGIAWMHMAYLYLGFMNFTLFVRSRGTPELGAMWSLAVEEQFYFVWPVLVFFLKPRHLVRILLLALLLAPFFRGLGTLWVQQHALNPYIIYTGTIFRMDCLAMGALITFAWRAWPDAIRRRGWIGLAIAVPLFVFARWLSRHHMGFAMESFTVHGNVVIFELTLAVSAGLVLWALGRRWTAPLRWGPMRWLARISYTFYLILEGVMALVSRYVHRPIVVCLIGFAVCAVYSELSWRWMEKPILHGGSRKVRRREKNAATQPHTDIPQSS